jgi:hypothetical protein
VFGLGYGELDAVVRVMHRVAPDNAALVARFKYMQRLGFPEGVNPGRGVRSVYGLEEALKVLLAFELLETGATPTRVVRMVRTGWSDLRRPLALGWLAARERGARPRRLMICATPGAFRELGEPDDPRAPVAEPLRPMRLDDLVRWQEAADETMPETATDVVAAGAPRRLVIDPMRLVAAFRAVVPAVSAMTVTDLDEAFAMLGNEVFEGTPEAAWADATRRNVHDETA